MPFGKRDSFKKKLAILHFPTFTPITISALVAMGISHSVFQLNFQLIQLLSSFLQEKHIVDKVPFPVPGSSKEHLCLARNSPQITAI